MSVSLSSTGEGRKKVEFNHYNLGFLFLTHELIFKFLLERCQRCLLL